MKLSPLNCCLISLVLLKNQVFAQTLATAKDPDQQPKNRGLGFVDEETKESDTEITPAEEELATPILLRKAEHRLGLDQEKDSSGRIQEQGSYLYRKESLSHLSQQSLSWNLGFSDEYSHTATLALSQQRAMGSHTPRFDLSMGSRFFKGSGASLEESYQGAYRAQEDFTRFDADSSQRSELGLRISDTLRFGQRDKLALVAEGRADKSYVPDSFEDRSQYHAVSLAGSLGEAREQKLGLSLKRSFLRYEDRRNQLTQNQGVTEAELSFLQKIAGRYYLGLGVKTYDGERTGPVLSWQRVSDSRSKAEAKVSYLKGEGQDQFLGQFQGQYLWTRQWTLVWNLEQGIDLLSSYQTLSQNGQRDITEQKINKTAELSLRYELGKTSWIAQARSSQQNFQSTQLKLEEATLRFAQQLTRQDEWRSDFTLRHISETNSLASLQDRRGYDLSTTLRHRFESSSHLLGEEYFAECGGASERLWEGTREREKISFHIALGQEWN